MTYSRMKDIIYSKLQKQRESIIKFSNVLEETQVGSSMNHQISNITSFMNLL
jgi:hypothetical protein